MTPQQVIALVADATGHTLHPDDARRLATPPETCEAHPWAMAWHDGCPGPAMPLTESLHQLRVLLWIVAEARAHIGVGLRDVDWDAARQMPGTDDDLGGF